jgi:hypothetical protein
MNILLEDFNAKVGREVILKPTVVNENFKQDSKGNGVRIVNYSPSNIQFSLARCPHTDTFISTFGSLLMGKIKFPTTTY